MEIDFATIVLCGLIFGAAVLYTSVGHAGASGYLAAMALMNVSPQIMRPTALTLNILVATLATLRWTRNGRDIAWRSLLPLVSASIPAAFLGGMLQLPSNQYRFLLGVILLAAGVKFLIQPKDEKEDQSKAQPQLPWAIGLITGGVIGLLSGLTGTGGGIFLTPILLIFGWAGARKASGLTAPFILMNSIAALAGNIAIIEKLPSELPLFVFAALGGALLGTQIGIQWTSSQTLQRLLGVVLLIAAGKFLLT
ncbi:MAG: sulfite exporter TauE/SafE family protein [Hyphomicrobium sp.]